MGVNLAKMQCVTLTMALDQGVISSPTGLGAKGGEDNK